MRHDFWVIALLHLDILLLLLTLNVRKPKTTAAHAIARYIQAIERAPLQPRLVPAALPLPKVECPVQS